jgi:uncharacterized alkaline shock family protein YloU
MSNEEKSLGRIEVAPDAIASIASHAVRQCYGVVGMANKNLADGITRLVSKEGHQGIDIHISDKEIVIDVYVVVEYGMRISAVANSVRGNCGALRGQGPEEADGGRPGLAGAQSPARQCAQRLSGP